MEEWRVDVDQSVHRLLTGPVCLPPIQANTVKWHLKEMLLVVNLFMRKDIESCYIVYSQF